MTPSASTLTPEAPAEPRDTAAANQQAAGGDQPARVCTCTTDDNFTACDTCIHGVYQLYCDGSDIAAIAAIEQIDPDRVRLLIGIEEHRRDLENYKMDEVPTEGLRALVRAATHSARGDDPRHLPPRIEAGRIPDAILKDLVGMLRSRDPMSMEAIAKRAGRSRSWVARSLGMIPYASKRSVTKPAGTFEDRVDVDVAATIIRAVGVAPCQVPWL